MQPRDVHVMLAAWPHAVPLLHCCVLYHRVLSFGTLLHRVPAALLACPSAGPIRRGHAFISTCLTPPACALAPLAATSAPCLRKALYDLFQSWCTEGYPDREGNEYRVSMSCTPIAASAVPVPYTAIHRHQLLPTCCTCPCLCISDSTQHISHVTCQPRSPPPCSPPQKLLTAGITASLLSTKDAGERESMRRQSLDLAELLDFVARSGMAAMLQGPVFDTDSRRPLGPVLQWVDTWVALVLLVLGLVSLLLLSCSALWACFSRGSSHRGCYAARHPSSDMPHTLLRLLLTTIPQATALPLPQTALTDLAPAPWLFHLQAAALPPPAPLPARARQARSGAHRADALPVLQP